MDPSSDDERDGEAVEKENNSEEMLNLSQVSNLSLELSQNTVNQLIMAAKNGSEETTEDDRSGQTYDSDVSDQRETTPPTSESFGTSTTVIHPSPTHSVHSTISDETSVGYQPGGGLSPHHYPSPTPQQLYHHHPSTSRTTPPPQATPSTVATPHSTSPSAMGSPACLSGQGSYDYSRCRIPSNVGFQGQYNFGLLLLDNEKPVPKTATFTYSTLTKRAYIRRDTVIGLNFTFSNLPPDHAVVRVMAIHKTPELVGEVLQCCPKHIDEQKRKFHLHPRHFVCGSSSNDAVYCEDSVSGRLSLTYCTGTLQQKAENVLQGLYTFPCFTSELHKGHGQLVQLIFTLEIAGNVIGRAVLDARVCASPGRDREHDESKLSPTASSCNSIGLLTPTAGAGPINEGGHGVLRKGRKRSASNQSESVSSLPSKMARNESDKEVFPIKTYPELFPFLRVCVEMMEKVYEEQQSVSHIAAAATASLPFGRANNTNNNGAHNEQRTSVEELQEDNNSDGDQYCNSPDLCNVTKTFESIERLGEFGGNSIVHGKDWLSYIGLPQYGPVLNKQGIVVISQVLGISKQQLRSYGITRDDHCHRLIDGLKLIKLATTPVKEERASELNSSGPFVPQLLYLSQSGRK